MRVKHNGIICCDAIGCRERAIGYTLRELRGMGLTLTRAVDYCPAHGGKV